jgi:hypothetical protein
MPIKDMRDETPMRAEPLPCHHVDHTFLLFCHVADMVSIRIHNHILIGLFEPTFRRKY